MREISLSEITAETKIKLGQESDRVGSPRGVKNVILDSVVPVLRVALEGKRVEEKGERA